MTVVETEGDLIARVEGTAGVIRLNRPKAINAVTLEMFRDIEKALDRFEADPAVGVILLEGAGERGLCAGGDIRALWESSKVSGDLGKILWREEYILNARIKKFARKAACSRASRSRGVIVRLAAQTRPAPQPRFAADPASGVFHVCAAYKFGVDCNGQGRRHGDDAQGESRRQAAADRPAPDARDGQGPHGSQRARRTDGLQ